MKLESQVSTLEAKEKEMKKKIRDLEQALDDFERSDRFFFIPFLLSLA